MGCASPRDDSRPNSEGYAQHPVRVRPPADFPSAVMPIWKCRWGGRAVVLALFLGGCQGAERAADRELSGAQLAERHCQSCHMLPQPAELDRET